MIKKKKRLFILGILCCTVVLMQSRCLLYTPRLMEGTSNEMTSETYQNCIKCTAYSRLSAPRITWCSCSGLPYWKWITSLLPDIGWEGTTIMVHLSSKITIIFWVILEKQRKEQFSQSHWFNVSDVFRNMWKGAAREGARQFTGMTSFLLQALSLTTRTEVQKM